MTCKFHHAQRHSFTHGSFESIPKRHTIWRMCSYCKDKSRSTHDIRRYKTFTIRSYYIIMCMNYSVNKEKQILQFGNWTHICAHRVTLITNRTTRKWHSRSKQWQELEYEKVQETCVRSMWNRKQNKTWHEQRKLAQKVIAETRNFSCRIILCLNTPNIRAHKNKKSEHKKSWLSNAPSHWWLSNRPKKT